MAKNAKILYVVELDVSEEAGKPDYWVIHYDGIREGGDICVYETKKAAVEGAKGRDHKSRIVRFFREGTVSLKKVQKSLKYGKRERLL